MSMLLATRYSFITPVDFASLYSFEMLVLIPRQTNAMLNHHLLKLCTAWGKASPSGVSSTIITVKMAEQTAYPKTNFGNLSHRYV